MNTLQVYFVQLCLQCHLRVLIRYETWKNNCKWQNPCLVLNKICLQNIISIVTNNKNELWKTASRTSFQKTTTAIRFNFLQVYPSLFCFLFAVSFIPSSNLLSDYLDVLLNLVAVLSVWIFMTQGAGYVRASSTFNGANTNATSLLSYIELVLKKYLSTNQLL